MMRKTGAIVNYFDGTDFEPFRNINKMKIDGLIIGFNQQIHQQIIKLIL